MATQPATNYGRDIACITDADAFFTDVTGLGCITQDAIHRLTTDDVLGPGGDGWGFNVRRLLGGSTSALAGMQPVLSEVLQRDPRILTADVTLTPTVTNGFADVLISVVATTALGPFSFIKSVQQLTASDIEGQGAP